MPASPSSAPSSTPGPRWPEIRAALADGGAAVVALVRGEPDAAGRRALMTQTVRDLIAQDWPGKSLETLAEIALSFVADLRGAAEADMSARGTLLDTGSALLLELAEAIMDDRPGDPLPRRADDFAIGLTAAEQALRWLAERAAGPRPFAAAHGARGYSLFRTGRASEAASAFREARLAAAKAAGQPPAPLTPQRPVEVLLQAGREGLALMAAGDRMGAIRFQEARASLTSAGEPARATLERLETLHGLAFPKG